EPVGTQLIDGVFQTGMTAFVAVAMVTLCGDNAFANGQQLLGADTADYAAQSPVGGVGAMCGTHAAANRDVKAQPLAVFNSRAQVVSPSWAAALPAALAR